MPLRRDDQMGLFSAQPPGLVEAAPASDSLRRLAQAVPPDFRFGTSSWAFPGWAGQVWAREYPEAVLAHQGLSAYAAHPLLRTVSIDRSYYAPLSAAQYAGYAQQVPADFRFVVKAPAELTSPVLRQSSARTGRRENPRFLDPAVARRCVVEPVMEGLGATLGMVLLQIPPMPEAWIRDPVPFAERLEAMLSSLPPALPRALELRNPQLLCEPVFAALERTGSFYCFTVHPAAASIEEQLARLPATLATRGPLLLRWNLRTGDSYEIAKARFAPFTHLQAEDRSNRPAIAAMCRRALAAGRPAYVIANNKAEGCAPQTLFRLAEEMVGTR